jgi:regulator of sigma D
MSEMEKREEISRYDSMSTEELQEILRKHAHDELDTEPEADELFEIMEVLSVRRQKEDPQAFRSNEEALADFRKNYMPKAMQAGHSKVVRFPNRAFKMVAAVLAIVLILAVGTSVTAQALHIDIWGKFAIWTKEIFQFTDKPQGTTAPNPEKEYNAELKSLQDALNDI